jgi:hypothetical protein
MPSLIGGAGFAAEAISFKNFADEAATLRKLVNHYAGDVALKQFVVDVFRAAGVAPKDEYGQALAIAEWVQKNIYYVHEGKETFQRPETTLRLRSGDCDDFALLISSCLANVQIREKLCILKINGRWAHIFPVAVVRDAGELHRLTLDATLDQPIRDLVNPIAMVRDRGDVCDPLFV